LKKLFAGVHSVVFDNSAKTIIAMKSIHGETVFLKNAVIVTDQVEVWLYEFTFEMKNTLRHLLNECLLKTDIVKYPTETICLAEYIHFTSNVEKVLNSNGNFESLIADLKAQLDKLTSLDAQSIENKCNREVMELKVKSLIFDVIHFIDVSEGLQRAKTESVSNWDWQRQLRFYIEGKVCKIRMHDAEFDYSYEYQGIPPKLVHTSLTDKCYLTLTQAMASGFGGNPFGPGKYV
jgi:dynein heavy chain 2, cytosolic